MTEYDFMTAEEVAEILRVPLSSLRYLRAKKDGPAYYKVGSGTTSAVRYLREDVDKWIEKQRHEPLTFDNVLDKLKS